MVAKNPQKNNPRASSEAWHFLYAKFRQSSFVQNCAEMQRTMGSMFPNVEVKHVLKNQALVFSPPPPPETTRIKNSSDLSL